MKLYLRPHSQDLVEIFHRKFKHPIARRLTMLDPALAELRVRLIASELCEYAAANGVQLHVDLVPSATNVRTPNKIISVQFQEWAATSMKEAADALGDLDYVVQGANICHGFPGAAILAEIHRSNMTKLGADGEPVYRADGKILKGPNYEEPQIQAVLDDYNEFCCAVGGDHPWGDYPYAPRLQARDNDTTACIDKDSDDAKFVKTP